MEGVIVPEFWITYRGTVYPWQCDHLGLMNVMWYTGKFDEASWQLFSKLGLTRARLRAEGAAMVAVEQRLEYKRELHAGDVVSIRSAVMEVKDKSIRMVHEMRNDNTGEVAAISVIVAVHLDATARRAQLLPTDVRDRAVLMAAGQIDTVQTEESFESGGESQAANVRLVMRK
jgi:acyl-CoA thioester hydrolase